MLSTKLKKSALPKTFEGLSRLLPLRPISDQVDFENAQEVIDALAILERRTKDQDEYLASLSILFEAYKRSRTVIDTSHVTPLAILKFLVEGHNMSASDLGRLLGSREQGVKIMNGSRQLSKANIRTLCDHFKIGADVLI